MQIREIEYIIVVSETGNLTGAANKLFISQPALSQAIKKLEQELGVELLRRETRSVKLTLAGEMLIEEGRKILNIRDDIVKKAADIGGLRAGRLRVAVTPLYGQIFFSRIYSEFHRAFPDIELVLIEAQGEEQEEMLLKRSIDVGIFASPSSNPNLIGEPIYHERMVLLMDTENALNRCGYIDEGSGMPFIDLYQLKDANFVGFTADRHNLNSKTHAICREHGFTPKIVFESKYSSVICSMVSSGLGIGLLSYMSVFGVPLINEKYQVNYYNITGKEAERSYLCTYPLNGYSSTAAKAFIDVCRNVHMRLVEKNHIMRFFLECKRIDWPQFARGRNNER